MAINIKFDDIEVKVPGGTPIWKPRSAHDFAVAMDISTAAGEELDKIAELWGLVRHQGPNGNPNEPDADLRYRIRNMAMGDSGGGYIDPNLLDFDDTPDTPKKHPEYGTDLDKMLIKKKCECGAASLGYTQPGPGHASWCPIASK
jgi:hypothetical protein